MEKSRQPKADLGIFQIWYDSQCLNYSFMFNNTQSLEVLEVVLFYGILQSAFNFITYRIFI